MLTLPYALYSRAVTCRSQSVALCWKITRTDGTVFRFTDWPHALGLRESSSPTVYTYTPTDGMDSSARRREEQLAPLNKEGRGIISSDQITLEDLRAGRFDGARVDEFLVDTLTPWRGYLEHIVYFVRVVSYDRSLWRADIQGLGARLDKPVGDLWGPLCRVDLFSTLCGLSSTSYEKTVEVTDILTDRKSFKVSFGGGVGSLWNANGYGNDGVLVWSSGALSGVTTQIKEYTWDGGTSRGTFVLHVPAPYAIAVGDDATVKPGCNKRSGVERDRTGALIAGHCKDRFNNLANFQGEPAIPNRDNALKGIPIK